MIYLASPYSHPDPAVREARFQAVSKCASEIMCAGEIVYCAISHTHPIAQYGLPKGWKFWQKFDRWFLERAEKLVVLKLHGWQESKGIQGEMKIANELNIPIEFLEE